MDNQKPKGKKILGYYKPPQLSLGWDIRQVNPSRSKSKEPVIKPHYRQLQKSKLKSQREIEVNKVIDYFPTQSNVASKLKKQLQNKVLAYNKVQKIQFYDEDNPAQLYGLLKPKQLKLRSIQSPRPITRSSSRPKDNIQSLGNGYNYFKEDKNARTPRIHKRPQLTEKVTQVLSPRYKPQPWK